MTFQLKWTPSRTAGSPAPRWCHSRLPSTVAGHGPHDPRGPRVPPVSVDLVDGHDTGRRCRPRRWRRPAQRESGAERSRHPGRRGACPVRSSARICRSPWPTIHRAPPPDRVDQPMSCSSQGSSPSPPPPWAYCDGESWEPPTGARASVATATPRAFDRLRSGAPHRYPPDGIGATVTPARPDAQAVPAPDDTMTPAAQDRPQERRRGRLPA